MNLKIKGVHYASLSFWAKEYRSEVTAAEKLEFLRRFHRQRMFDANGHVHTRALHRLAKTKTASNLADDRAHARMIREGERLTRLGY